MKTIRKIDPFSLAKVQAVIFFALSIVMALVVGVFLYALSSVGIGGAKFNAFWPILIPFALMPFLHALMGFVVGFVMAWIYNLISATVGGIRMEIE